MTKPDTGFSERKVALFLSKVDKSDADGCWLWTGAKLKGGYGQFGVGRKTYSTHRVAWVIEHGPIPKGEGPHGTCVCHHCDTPGCCRPSHLFLGSQEENNRDRAEKGRTDRTHKARGENAGRSKLTEEQVREILLHPEISQAAFARKFALHPSSVHLIRNRTNWAHVEMTPPL
ncbi:MAG: HNH endonuclease signature motif containing protein [Armatimonadota bacterium]